jgi:hypothetical protein
MPAATAKLSITGLYNAVCKWVSRYIKANYFLVFLFGYTAISKLHPFSAPIPFSWETFKLVDVSQFKTAMFNAPELRPYIRQLTWLIPVSQLAVCLLLIFDKSKRLGYYLSLHLLILFTGYILYMLTVHPHRLPCTCAGITAHMTWEQHFLFNFFFIFITARAIYLIEKSIVPEIDF